MNALMNAATATGIELRGISKNYDGRHVLGPIDLTIEHGGVTALIGPNGAGKSTMLTIIGRLLDADSGRVTVGGLDVRHTKSKELARVVSILKQENHFMARLTVRQLVAFGRFPHSAGRLTETDERAIHAAIAFLDLAGLEHRFIDELSGGQRQRAFVAMVLAQDTDYVLLDEPLTGLDMRHGVAMMGQVRAAAAALGKTVVLVIHDVNFAAASPTALSPSPRAVSLRAERPKRSSPQMCSSVCSKPRLRLSSTTVNASRSTTVTRRPKTCDRARRNGQRIGLV